MIRMPFRVACVLFLLGAAPVFAHAALVGSDPADRAVLASSPARFVLTFDEPVSPLVIRLVGTDGTSVALSDYHLEGPALVIDAPPVGQGTHALSWRVISADGHPVGGTIVFSIGAPSSAAPDLGREIVDWPVRVAIWIARVLLYLGLFVGIGGTLFAASIAPAPRAARCIQAALLVVGLLSILLSVGLQGLDALDVPLSGLARPLVWRTGFENSYGTAACIAAVASLLALAALRLRHAASARILALAAAALAGVALASTGHASAASPQWLTRPAVFLHVVAIAFWIGALLPLGLLLREGGPSAAALARFSRAIPFAVAPLVAAGIVLAVIQVGEPAALWTTAYGRVLLAKLALLVALFGLAAINRWRLTGAAAAGEAVARKRLVRATAAELVLAVAIFGVVATWRFTPPPRALQAAAAAPASVHIHTAKAMAEVTITPGHAGPVSAKISVLTGDFGPLDAKEVTLALSDPAAGVEPIKRPATKSADGTWRVDGLTVPVPGHWDVDVAILLSEFELVHLRDAVDIR
jgi:copper transport protein